MTVAEVASSPTGSVPTPPFPSEPRAPVRVPGSEACPLCGAPLDPRQDWCLRCGAAARTRLAATPNWKAPIAVIAAIAALALGVLAASLVKLAGESGPSGPPVTTTITASTPSTTPSSAIPGVPTPTAPGSSSPTTPTGTATATTATTTPTAQGPNAGGLADPSNAPTATAKGTNGAKALETLPPSARKSAERLLKVQGHSKTQP